MKVLAVLVLLVAAVSAVPAAQLDGRNLPVDQIIIDYILDLSQRIRARGLDPYQRAIVEGSYGLPGDRIFTASGEVHDIYLGGLSNIVINSVNYNAGSGLVTFDLQMPGITGSVGYASGQVKVFGHDIAGIGNGRLSVSDIRVRGVVSISFGVTGVLATNANIDASIGNISSDIFIDFKIGSRQYELGQYLNRFFNDILLDRLEQFQDEINRLIAIYLVRYINRN